MFYSEFPYQLRKEIMLAYVNDFDPNLSSGEPKSIHNYNENN